MTYQVEFTKESAKDLRRLDNSQRIQIRKSLVKLETLGMEAGQALHGALSGSLSGCRKLKHKRLGLRIVFRQKASGIEIIEIVVVGKRSDNEVYKIAQKLILKRWANRLASFFSRSIGCKMGG